MRFASLRFCTDGRDHLRQRPRLRLPFGSALNVHLRFTAFAIYPRLPPTGLLAHLRVGELARVPIAAAMRRVASHMILLALATAGDDAPTSRVAVTPRKRRTLRPGVLASLDAATNVLDVALTGLIASRFCHFDSPSLSRLKPKSIHHPAVLL